MNKLGLFLINSKSNFKYCNKISYFSTIKPNNERLFAKKIFLSKSQSQIRFNSKLPRPEKKQPFLVSAYLNFESFSF